MSQERTHSITPLIAAIALLIQTDCRGQSQGTPPEQERVSQLCPYALPFQAQGIYEVTQGNLSPAAGWSHAPGRAEQYAFDFGLPGGTEVLASRSGVVSDRRDGSTTCGGQEMEAFSNFVIVDHGGGTFALYNHLRAGIPVQRGSPVEQGQLLGYSGNTGYSNCGPNGEKGYHLHFQLQETGQGFGDSIPIACFAGVEGAIPQQGMVLAPQGEIPYVRGNVSGQSGSPPASDNWERFPDFPIPPDAQKLEIVSNTYFCFGSREMTQDALIRFYREGMPPYGWSEFRYEDPSSSGPPYAGEIYFDRPGARAAVRVAEGSGPGPLGDLPPVPWRIVCINTIDWRFFELGDSSACAGFPPLIPDLPSNIPIFGEEPIGDFSDISYVDSASRAFMLKYRTQARLERIRDYYDQNLLAAGWSLEQGRPGNWYTHPTGAVVQWWGECGSTQTWGARGPAPIALTVKWMSLTLWTNQWGDTAVEILLRPQ